MFLQACQSWIFDFTKDHKPLDRVKLCLLGPANSGKTTLRETLGRDYLQSLLGLEDESSVVHRDKRTIGISVSSLSLTSRETFQVWDFASDVDHYITHQFFVTNENTAYAVVLDLTNRMAALESELAWWLEFIAMHNLGAIPFYQYKSTSDLVSLQPLVQYKMDQGRTRSSTLAQSVSVRSRLQSVSSAMTASLLPIKQARSPSRSMCTRLPSSTSLSSVPATNRSLGATSLTPIPVFVVGTHADVLSDVARYEKVSRMEAIVRSKTGNYEDSLDLFPQIFAVNCLKSRTSEMKLLKEQLCRARAAILEVRAVDALRKLTLLGFVVLFLEEFHLFCSRLIVKLFVTSSYISTFSLRERNTFVVANLRMFLSLCFRTLKNQAIIILLI